jgi:hypothetical protein
MRISEKWAMVLALTGLVGFAQAGCRNFAGQWDPRCETGRSGPEVRNPYDEKGPGSGYINQYCAYHRLSSICGELRNIQSGQRIPSSMTGISSGSGTSTTSGQASNNTPGWLKNAGNYHGNAGALNTGDGSGEGGQGFGGNGGSSGAGSASGGSSGFGGFSAGASGAGSGGSSASGGSGGFGGSSAGTSGTGSSGSSTGERSGAYGSDASSRNGASTGYGSGGDASANAFGQAAGASGQSRRGASSGGAAGSGSGRVEGRRQGVKFSTGYQESEFIRRCQYFLDYRYRYGLTRALQRMFNRNFIQRCEAYYRTHHER